MEQNPLQPVQLRSGLEFSRQQHQGKTYVVVKDPITTRYFRFTESQAAILDLIEAPIDARSLAALASEKLGGFVSVHTIGAFLQSLEQKHLLDTAKVRETLHTIKSRKLEDHGLLYWKLASLNPERLFTWLLPRTHWAFTSYFQVFAAFAILSGLLITYIHVDRLAQDVQGLFNFHGLFFLWIVTFGIVTMHEFAHGLTCRHFGGNVKELGFMLIYFQPAFYCDVSDSWMFPSKRDRMLVTFAGGYFQMVVWGVATMIWRITDSDTTINQIALVVNVFAGLQTLVNFNPLIKLDGYYMLSDYLEIPNLRAKSYKTLWGWISGDRSIRARPNQRAQLFYGIASFAFSTTLLVTVYAALYTWATSLFSFAGLLGFAMFSSFTLRGSASEYVAGLRAVAVRAAFHKYRNAGIVAAGVLVSLVGHWELKIPAEFRVIARNELAVRPETGGIIVEMLVREGAHVAKGDVLARLRDFDKQHRISEIAGDLEKKRSELALLRAGARHEELDRKQKLVETKRVELSNARRNQERRSQLQQGLERKWAEFHLDQQTLARSRDLFASGLIARADLDRAETSVNVRNGEIAEIEASIRVLSETSDREADLKSGELAEAESELKLMQAGYRPELITQGEAEVSKLEGQLAMLEQELRKTAITAPIDGVVATPFIERKLNQYLRPGDELCRIVDIEHVTIEMQVPEKELGEVRPGHLIWMKPRSFPSVNLQGRVDFIAPVAQTVNGQQVVIVRSEVPNEGLLLKPDMTGVAKIYCGRRRIINVMTRRVVRWVRTEFWDILP